MLWRWRRVLVLATPQELSSFWGEVQTDAALCIAAHEAGVDQLLAQDGISAHAFRRQEHLQQRSVLVISAA